MTARGVHPIRIDEGPSARSAVLVDGDRLVVEHLAVTDPEAVRIVATAPEDDRAEVLQRIISVGARGLTSMGIGLDIAGLDDRVRSAVSSATDEAERVIREILETGRRTLGDQFDPEQRSSVVARTLAEFTTWRDGFVRTLDPAVDGSAATALVERLQALVGPDGALEERLTSALDLDADGSSFARLAATIDERFAELRRDIARAQGAEDGRTAEAERGTAHGLDFEDLVEGHLRDWAGHRSGTIVERTGRTSGDLGSSSKVGDFVVSLPGGGRIVVEAKRHAAITLTGGDGILAELDRAMANRRADVAVCIAGRDAFPVEVGAFNVYGDRILVVDEGDGAMTAVAMQWAVAALGARSSGGAPLDAAAVADRVLRIRKAAQSLSGARRSVTGIRGSLDKLHEVLGELRNDLLDQVGDLDRLLSLPESLGDGDSPS